jgi:hypothetical protein
MENETVKLMFDGIEKECTISIDRNGEYLCEAEDGSFAKFLVTETFEEDVAAYNEANSKEVEIIPEIIYENVVYRDADGNEIVK